MVISSRYWSFVYRTDCSLNITDFLSDLVLKDISFVVSPLHDKDISINDGSLCKPHFHIMLLFDFEKSFDEVKVFTDPINAYPHTCSSPHLMVRYFCHLDHPNKELYSVDDCLFYCDKCDLRDILLSSEMG